ncbi:MAG: T9SS type A sorting domain-containing protein, partial [Bacteroidota bacterium]
SNGNNIVGGFFQELTGKYAALRVFARALQDTAFHITLEVTDREGETTSHPIQVIANEAVPNNPPEVTPIPEQRVQKGVASFPSLNLHQYMTDDYVARADLAWERSDSDFLNGLNALFINDSTVNVSLEEVNVTFKDSIRFRSFEKTNTTNTTDIWVVYEVVDGPTYTISGTITVDGQPLSGVQLTGFPSSSVITDHTGQYTVEVPAGWFGTITPVLKNYSFDPASSTHTSISMNLAGHDYEASYDEVVTYTISGTVTLEGQLLSGVELQGFPSSSVITNNVGQYTAEVPSGWSGTVTPVLEGYRFAPGSNSYSEVAANLSNQDYEASLNRIITYTISGTITVGGQPLSGVQLNGFPSSSTVTDSVGQYTAEVPSGWSGEVTPLLEDYLFDPESIMYTMVSTDMIEDYSGTFDGIVTYTISGIVSAEGQPLSGVQLTGLPSSLVITDKVGQYVAEVPSGWSGEVTPVLGDYRFNPRSLSYQNIASDQTNQSFNAQTVTGINPEINEQPLQVFPNPSTNEVYFRVNHTSFTTGQIIMFSASGNQMEVINLIAGVETYRLQVKGDVRYTPGVYIAKLYLDKKLKATAKVIIAE